jgi:Na+/proline symporter
VNGALLDGAAPAAVGAYLCSLLLIGYLARRARGSDDVRDFYLAGGSLGFFTLFFTLYATQYSGNTLLATPGKAYRSGFDALAVALAVMAVALVYSTFAPRLNRLAAEHSFITVGDFLRWRYPSARGLLIVCNLVLLLTLTTYALGNLKAVGLLLESLTGGALGFAPAILCMAVIMAFYEAMGGMRGVVWTDVIQGLILLVGCLLIFGAVFQASPEGSVTHPQGLADELGRYVAQQLDVVNFTSLVLLIGVGAAVYPQAVQRIYAARDVGSLRRSYRTMFFMPLLTTLPMLLVGMSVAEWQPALSLAESERVVLYAISRVVEQTPALSWLMVLCLAAALAAIMSTIDSALLSLGSIVTGDLLGSRLSGAPTRALRASRLTAGLLMLLMATLAIVLPQSIWALMVFKFELLVQLAPAVILGVRRPGLSAPAVLGGLLAGIGVAVTLKFRFAEGAELLGIHSGVWGLLANLAVMPLVERWRRGG